MHLPSEPAVAPEEPRRRRPVARARFLTALGLALVTVVAAHAEFRAGAALRVITPDPLLPVSGGFGPTHPVTEKRGELAARAFVLQQDTTTVALVSVDLLGFPSVLADRAGSRVPRIAAENILIGATHTHSAPDCYAFPDGQGGHTGDLAYLDWVCGRVAEAINEALDRSQPAVLRVATGLIRGKVAYNAYAPELFDRRASVLQALTPGGEAIATLVNYAVHPEVLGPEQGLVSPDLVGPLNDRIENRVGGLGLFMNGAQGGMVTADNRDLDRPRDARRAQWHDVQTWDECVRIGTTLADEALALVQEAAIQRDPELFCASTEVLFPVDSDGSGSGQLTERGQRSDPYDPR